MQNFLTAYAVVYSVYPLLIYSPGGAYFISLLLTFLYNIPIEEFSHSSEIRSTASYSGLRGSTQQNTQFGRYCLFAVQQCLTLPCYTEWCLVTNYKVYHDWYMLLSIPCHPDSHAISMSVFVAQHSYNCILKHRLLFGSN